MVDVVYTWVNGSDPLHQASLEQMKLQRGMLGACNGSLEECDVDSIATASRFQGGCRSSAGVVERASIAQ